LSRERLPTHLPLTWPTERSIKEKAHYNWFKTSKRGEALGFTAQLYCASGRLEIPEVLCVHLYQMLDGPECPLAVPIPIGAPLNERRDGVMKDGVENHDVSWTATTEPEALDDDDERRDKNKIGGVPFDDYYLREQDRFLMMLNEEVPGLELTSYNFYLVSDEKGRLLTRLW